MKCIIAGGRKYILTVEDFQAIDKLHEEYGFTEIVSGGARGADAGGEAWATKNKVPIKKFPASWHTDGMKAGMIRNIAMAEYADVAIIFPGGNGTANMVKNCEKYNVPIINSI